MRRTLFFNLLIALLVFSFVGQLKSQSSSDSTGVEEVNLATSDLQKKIEFLEQDVKGLKELKEFYSWVAGIGAAALALLVFFGGRALVRAWLKEEISKRLADQLQVKVEVLEEALTDLTKDYSAKHDKKILIISDHEDQNAEIRAVLMNGGIDRSNLFFQGIHEKHETNDIDLILFNDLFDSSLKNEDMASVIEQLKGQVKVYFYVGASNDLPMREWRDEYNIFMSGANFKETIVRNLINALKNN